MAYYSNRTKDVERLQRENFKALRLQECVKLPFGLIVKRSRSAKITEAHTVRFIALNTKIPVSKMYCAFYRKKTGHTYIVQQRMKGERLGQSWDDQSEEIRSTLFAPLKTMMDEMRAIKPPPGNWSPQYLRRLHVGLLSWETPIGPFATVDDFHLW